eukprot:INCI739.2.p1 GENE.INCI739.2~~INCI739.2.p1  ORF type:complete len:759 (+),score=116.20 INCI739.2:208-2484(+)
MADSASPPSSALRRSSTQGENNVVTSTTAITDLTEEAESNARRTHSRGSGSSRSSSRSSTDERMAVNGSNTTTTTTSSSSSSSNNSNKSNSSSSKRSLASPAVISNNRPHLYVGRDFTFAADLEDSLQESLESRFDFIATPLVHPRHRRDARGVSGQRELPFTRSDRLFPSSKWSNFVVGKLSRWFDFETSDAGLRGDSEAALMQEVMWATHLSIPGILAPPPRGFACFNYARAINTAMHASPSMQVWVEIPMVYPRSDVSSDDEDNDCNDTDSGTTASAGGVGSKDAQDPWEAWNNLRVLCGHNRLLSVALVMTGDLCSPTQLRRWLAEPLRAVILPTSIFIANRKGFPTLAQAHQRAVLTLMETKTQFIVRGQPRHERGMLPYWQYIQFLGTKRPPLTAEEEFEGPFYDYLQMPLQPLKDNLESATYEVFEKDPVKYVQYENAVCGAIKARHARKLELGGDVHDPVIVMVVGAGRGPLVLASLRASVTAGIPIKVWAVEKNPNAVVTLRCMKHDLRWEDRVTIVASDMREWKAPCKADVLVSELLGSFGDNELSPECLDGAQSFLHAEGISVPQNYTSFLAPIQSSKLWNEVGKFGEASKFETPFVVRMHQFMQLAESQKCFRYHHPNRPHGGQEIDNRRMVNLTFIVKASGMVHGFAGYFESELFGPTPSEDFSAELPDRGFISINPQTFSTGMFSWFPLFLPLKDPVHVTEGGTVQVQLWRCEDKQKVWYEWALLQPQISQLHNPMGRAYSIGL